MKTYKIKNWSEYFENNRSKTVKDLHWVPIPNKHDGERYTKIMLHENGAKIFSAWILLLQVASRCQPRGSLVRSNGTPYDSEALSLKTRAPAEWFDISIPFLMEIAWLETVASDCQDPDAKPAASCQAIDEEGREGNGKKVSAVPQTEHQMLISSWNSAFKGFFGFEYTFGGGRDGKAVKELLQSTRTTKELIDIAEAGWSCGDELISNNCRTIWGFRDRVSQIESLVKSKKKPVFGKDYV